MIEFDLTVRKKGYKPKKDRWGNEIYPEDKSEEPEILEELKFNTLRASEVIRKLLDYITD